MFEHCWPMHRKWSVPTELSTSSSKSHIRINILITGKWPCNRIQRSRYANWSSSCCLPLDNPRIEILSPIMLVEFHSYLLDMHESVRTLLTSWTTWNLATRSRFEFCTQGAIYSYPSLHFVRGLFWEIVNSISTFMGEPSHRGLSKQLGRACI